MLNLTGDNLSTLVRRYFDGSVPAGCVDAPVRHGAVSSCSNSTRPGSVVDLNPFLGHGDERAWDCLTPAVSEGLVYNRNRGTESHRRPYGLNYYLTGPNMQLSS